MKRDIYHQLCTWKAAKNRKPLIIKGARQVGKTYLLKDFAAREYKSMVYLNFDADPLLASLFEGKLEPASLIQHLSLYFHQTISPQETLLIFDEIQECPAALNSLKYFYEEAPEYHIVAAGSLLGVCLANSKGFPVGKVHFMELYPLSYFEYLTALGRHDLRMLLEQVTIDQKIPELLHEELLRLLRYYLYIGGMPEAVAHYLETEDITNIRTIQQDILSAYTLDFSKHAKPHDLMKIMDVWQKIPSQLAKENKKFIFSVIAASARAREYEAALQWLTQAGLITCAYHISKPELPLSHYGERTSFKVYLLDVGLLGAMTQTTPDLLVKGAQLFTEFKGCLTENYVAQALVAKAPHTLYYWSSTGTAEVDFITPYKENIYPLEVKAGITTKHKSLTVYAQKYQPLALCRTNLLNLAKADIFYNIPLYLISRFPELITS